MLSIWGLVTLDRNSDDFAALLLFIAGTFLLITIGVNLGHGFIPPTHTAGVLAKDNLCGSCLESIEGIAPDVDGCVSCKTCGAAWRIAPQTQP